MVLLLVFLLSLCTNFDVKSMHDTIWGPVNITTNQAWPSVHKKTVPVISEKSETKSPSPTLSAGEEENDESSQRSSPVSTEDSDEFSDFEQLAKQVAHATLCDEEAEPKEGAAQD